MLIPKGITTLFSLCWGYQWRVHIGRVRVRARVRAMFLSMPLVKVTSREFRHFP